MASSGMRASRSIRRAVDRASRRSRAAWRGTPRRAGRPPAAGSGCGWIRSSRKRPRNSSLAKLGLRQSCSRAASATWRASRSETVGVWSGWCGHEGSPRRESGSWAVWLPTGATRSYVPDPGRPHHPLRSRSADVDGVRLGVQPPRTLEDLASGPGSGGLSVVSGGIGPDGCPVDLIQRGCRTRCGGVASAALPGDCSGATPPWPLGAGGGRRSARNDTSEKKGVEALR